MKKVKDQCTEALPEQNQGMLLQNLVGIRPSFVKDSPSIVALG